MPRRKYKKPGAICLVEKEHPAASNNLLAYLDKLQPLTNSFKDLIRPMLKSYVAGRSFSYAKAGDEMKTAFWIEYGYIRLYRNVQDKDGVTIEQTVFFGIPQSIFWVPECFFSSKKCAYHVEISERTVVVPFTSGVFEEWKVSVPEMERLANLILVMGSAEEMERTAMMRLKGVDMYNQFIALYGEQINDFFKQKDLASFLGISAVYMSSLRKKRNRRKVR